MKKCIAFIMLIPSLLWACTPAQQESTVSSAATTAPAQQTTQPTQTTNTFEAVTVVDNACCTIRITGIQPDAPFGYGLQVYLENKSADTNYMMAVDWAAINGVQADPFYATEVAAGKKANDRITFAKSSIDHQDIGEYTDIELHFRVYDSDDWSAEPVAQPSIRIYPQGPDQAGVYTRPAQPQDQVLVDNAQVTVIVTGYEMDSVFGYCVKLYMVNKTDTVVMFSADDAAVNGFMLDPLFAQTVQPGKCAFESIYWLESDLVDNGITQVEEITFLLRAYDQGNWQTDDLAHELVTLNPLTVKTDIRSSLSHGMPALDVCLPKTDLSGGKTQSLLKMHSFYGEFSLHIIGNFQLF